MNKKLTSKHKNMSVIRHIDETRIPHAEATVYHGLSRHPETNTTSDHFLQANLTL